MGSDDPKKRRSYAAPPSVLLGGIFVLGLGMGVFLTLLAAAAVPERGKTFSPSLIAWPCRFFYWGKFGVHHSWRRV
jgi:hypothetical protein